MKTKVAIQGARASFHEIAALQFFPFEIKTVECDTFQKLVDKVLHNKVDFALMAIENSVAGSILPNYALLRDNNLKIFGEVYLRIEMNLMALKGQKISSITEVHSHPMALLQCIDFFKKHPHIQLIESKDTALSAEEIAINNIRHRGALASNTAAKLFDLEILGKSIESNKRNFTRFLAIKREESVVDFVSNKINKSTISFSTSHLPGSLAKILTIFGNHDINLSKIQSLPILGKEWRYFMYADLEFDNYNSYQKALNEASKFMTDKMVLGEYMQGEKNIL
jgi:prephenate dehydratase